jgi:hypothetical protein
MIMLAAVMIIGAGTRICLGQAHRYDPSEIPDRSPLAQEYEGHFIWDESDQDQLVRIFIDSVEKSNGTITATGRGEYTVESEVTRINITIKIDEKTLRFEMWEHDPDNAEGFVTDGSHVGTITPDFADINAIWTTKGDGDRGVLSLHKVR